MGSRLNRLGATTDAPLRPLATVVNPMSLDHKKIEPPAGDKEQTPLSLFVRERLVELGMKQADFCRLHNFDQGMLSRIQNSMAFNLNLESGLRLAVGLQVSPLKIFALIGRPELHELIRIAYARDWPELAAMNTGTPS